MLAIVGWYQASLVFPQAFRMSESLRQTIDSAQRGWVGCCWETAFGSRKLNLCGLTSRQALLAARALRGEEASCWREAAEWLRRVEADAAKAKQLAEQAWTQATANHFVIAHELLSESATLEAKYPLAARYRECVITLDGMIPEKNRNPGRCF